MKNIENTYYFFSLDKFEPKSFFTDLFSENKTEVDKTSVNSLNTIINIPLNNQIFQYEHNNISYEWECSINKMNTDKTVYEIKINFFYPDKKEKAAEAFSQLIQCIQKYKKNQFNMVSIKDSLSIYFSQKLFSSLAMYEHSLRALILAIFVPIYKVTWPQELNASVGEKIPVKGNTKEKLEKTLEELDLNELETIFFESHLTINSKNYNEKFNITNLDELTQEELIQLIKHNQPLSLWEQQINKYVDIENPKVRMVNIRNLRNRIAHNKTFSHKNYINLKEELNYMSKKINEATEKIITNISKNITLEAMASINDSYSDVLRNLNISIIDSTRELAQSMSELRGSIQTNIPLKELATITRSISATIPESYLNDIKSLAKTLFLSSEEEDDDEITDNEREDDLDN